MLNESSKGGGVESVHRCSAANADPGKDEESLPAAGSKGALVGLTIVVVAEIIVVDCMISL